MPSLVHPPTITSNGGGDTATVTMPENVTAATIVSATDPDPGTTLQYSIAGGSDASLFHIDSTTGALSLIAVPDYEAPGDADHNNSYQVVVRASDGSLSDDQTIAVNISDVSDNFVPVTRFGNEFLVNTTTLDHQYTPSVAAFSDGRFVSVWTDNHPSIDDSGGGAIRGQIFDAAGGKIGTEFLVNTTTAGQQTGSSVAMLADGRFVVSWTDYSAYGDAGSGPAVRAQIFNGSGAKFGAELFVSTTSEGPAPVAAGLADGGFVMAWTTATATGPDTNGGIRAQVFNGTGMKSGAEFQVNTTTAGFQYQPAITTLSNNDFVVTWTDPSTTGGDQSMLAVRGQIFHPSGAPVGGEFLVNTTTLESQGGPTITALADGRFVAAWTDWSETGGDTDATAVRGQVFDANGSKSGAEFLIDSTTTISNQWAPSIAGLPDGRFVAAWLDASTSQQLGSNHAIRAQVFNSDGSKSSVELLVDANDSLHFAPRVAALADGRFVVNWSDQRQADGDTSGMGIRGQIFDPRGDAVHLTGTPRNDDFVGTRFDDSFSGGAGNDRFNAGSGDDTAIFSQSFTKYAIQALGSDTIVVSGPDGGDMLTSVEHLNFSDAILDVHSGALITLDLDSSDATAPGTGYVTMLTQPGVRVSIAGNSQIQDINPNGVQTITGAKVVLTNAHAGDSLSISGSLPNGMTSAIDSSVAGVITLTVSGDNSTALMSHADYQAALSQITFTNSNTHANTTDRNIMVTVSENGVDSNVAHTTVHIMAAFDDAPVAQNGSASGNEDTTITGTLAATDIDSTPLTFSPVTQASHGSVTVNANGTFSYTPDENFNGTDSFTFQANDRSLGSNTATISLTVYGVNDSPVITSDGDGDTLGLSVAENTTEVTTVVATDVDSNALFYSIVGGSDADKFQINAVTGVMSFVTAPDFEAPSDSDHNNSYLVEVRSSDGTLFDEQIITVSVNDVNEVLVPDPTPGSAGEGPDDLQGGSGDDILDGQGGNDVIRAGPGSDVIFAGAGDDVVSGGDGPDVILGQDGNDTIGGDDGADHINGGDGNDVLFGGTGNDELGGGGGDDIIVGQDGNDVIFGEDGNDVANGGAGADIMLGGAGNDTFGGGADNDVIVGGDGADLLFGEDGADNINGGPGDDGVVGGPGDDILGGGDGNDIVVGDDGNDVMFGEAGNDAMNGGFGNDTVLGGDGDDTIGGGAGDDNMQGGFGNDTIFGENGNDLISGGAGNDVLIGGGNDDVFVFSPGDGADTIADFFAGAPEDKIWFAGTDLHSFADVQAHATTVVGNTVITYNGFFTVTLNGVTAGQLTAGDFIFT